MRKCKGLRVIEATKLLENRPIYNLCQDRLGVDKWFGLWPRSELRKEGFEVRGVMGAAFGYMPG